MKGNVCLRMANYNYHLFERTNAMVYGLNQ